MSILSKAITGIIGRPQKVVIYATEGFGKSTIASQFPRPIFFDIEGSTSQLNVARIGRDSLPDLLTVESAITEVAASQDFDTLVVDTVDWLEHLVEAAVLKGGDPEGKKKNLTSIEAFGYGKGFVYLRERFQKTLALFDKVIESGKNVVFLAHSIIGKLDLPDGEGSYNRYALKLSKHVEPLVKEWCDMLLFGKYRTQIVEKEDGKLKGVGGKERELHSERCAAHDAKNRHGMKPVEKWGIEAIKEAFLRVGSCWGAPAVVSDTGSPSLPDNPPPIENVKDAGEVAKQIIEDLKPDEIPMESELDAWFRQLCEPHRAAVEKYLREVVNERFRIPAEAPFEHVSPEYKKRVKANPAGFMNLVKGASK